MNGAGRVRAPPAGAALCDRLCFAHAAEQAGTLRSSLLRAQQQGNSLAEEIHVRNGNLPWWWLLLQASFCVPIQITFGILQLVLVPANVALLVGSEDKARYLGYTVTIMMVIQNCQPIMGSISDKTRSRRFGRRRPYIIFGQVLSVAALVIMRNATGFWTLCWGYQIYQVGNCFAFATWCAIQPGLRENQRGMFGGYVSLGNAVGYLGAALLGLAAGKHWLSHNTVWAILIALQFPLLLIGLASFSASPGFWQPELDALTPAEKALQQRLRASVAAQGLGAQLKAAAVDMAAPFRNAVFTWLFIYFIINGVALQITITFTQYFLSDVIGGPFVLYLPFGAKPIPIANNAESAISFLNMMNTFCTAPFAPVGGWLADRYDRSVVLSLTVVICSGCIAVTAWTSSYTVPCYYSVVLWMGVLQGIFGALGGGANYALIADAVDKGSGGGGDGADGGGGGGGNSNAARDYTILQTLGANLPGMVVPSLCGSLLTVFSDRAHGYRVFWWLAAGFSALGVPVLLWFVKPAASRTSASAAAKVASPAAAAPSSSASPNPSSASALLMASAAHHS